MHSRLKSRYRYQKQNWCRRNRSHLWGCLPKIWVLGISVNLLYMALKWRAMAIALFTFLTNVQLFMMMNRVNMRFQMAPSFECCLVTVVTCKPRLSIQDFDTAFGFFVSSMILVRGRWTVARCAILQMLFIAFCCQYSFPKPFARCLKLLVFIFFLKFLASLQVELAAILFHAYYLSICLPLEKSVWIPVRLDLIDVEEYGFDQSWCDLDSKLIEHVYIVMGCLKE